MTSRDCVVDYNVMFNQLKNACIHRLDEDPQLENLKTALFWFNKGGKKLKYFNGNKVCFVVEGDDIETCVHRLLESAYPGELLVSGPDRDIDKYQGDEGIVKVDINGLVKAAVPNIDYLKTVKLTDMEPSVYAETFDISENYKLATVMSIKNYINDIIEMLGLGDSLISQTIVFSENDWIQVGDNYNLIYDHTNFSIIAKTAIVYTDTFDEIMLYKNVQDTQVILGSSFRFNGYVVIMGDVSDTQADDPIYPVTDESAFIFDDPTQTIIDYLVGVGGLNVVIPQQIRGLDVLRIGEEAFAYKGIRSIVIPDVTTHIMTDAFRNNLLAKIVLPESLIFMGQGAFRSNSITEVNIPSNLTGIFANAFSGNNILNITIPDNITTIGDSAFQYNRLESLTLPNSITTLGIRSFGNNKIPYLVLPSSVTEIPNYCFENNIITTLHVPSGVTYIGDGAFYNNRITSAHLPNTVAEVGDNAFRDNAIQEVTLPNILTHLNNGVFYNNAINSITLPSSLLYMGIDTLRKNNLSTITIPSNVIEVKRRSLGENNLNTINIGELVVLDINILSEDNNLFRDEYTSENSSAGTYVGTQNGAWSKI